MIEITVDVFGDAQTVVPFVRDREDDWHVSWRREFDAKGHFDFIVPFDPTVTKTVFLHGDLSEIVQEAQVRKIKDVKVRGLIRVTMTPEEFKEFDRKGQLEFDIQYDIMLINYTTFDGKHVVLDDQDQQLLITDYLRSQVTSALAKRVTRFSPTATVIVRRI